MEEYRLKSSIRAVRLDTEEHGEFTILPPGHIVRISGESALRGFIEVLCDGQRVSVFREDLENKGEKVNQ